MSKLLGTIWPLEPHTAMKHEILQRYFQAWLPILAQTNGQVVYIDGFAGPGEYSKGEPGSPVIVLKAARDHKHKLASGLYCLFVEAERDRYEHLNGVLAALTPPLPNNIKFKIVHGTFNEEMLQRLKQAAEKRKNLTPTLAFIDPFGFSQTPFTTIAEVLKQPKCEVLVNFMYGWVNRFLSVSDHAEHFDSLFGTREWRQAAEISEPIERLRAIHDLYLKQLRTVAKHVHSFVMVNKSNTVEYFLFFATNNLTGLERMKHAMWKVDPTGEFQFSDFTNASRQELLPFVTAPDYDWLREILAEDFRHTEIEIETLGDWVVSETPFLRTHIRKHVLIPMEKEGAVSVVDPKPGRRPYTYPEGTILKFR